MSMPAEAGASGRVKNKCDARSGPSRVDVDAMTRGSGRGVTDYQEPVTNAREDSWLAASEAVPELERRKWVIALVELSTGAHLPKASLPGRCARSIL